MQRNNCGLCNTLINKITVVRGNTVILKDINFQIRCGEITALIGPNGGGKSTLLKAILGQIEHEGSIVFVNDSGQLHKRPLIGYVPQKLDIDVHAPISVMDLFTAVKTNLPIFSLVFNKKLRSEVKKSLAKVHGEKLIDKRLGDLSGGELQRVMLALALDPVPELLLLDEPTSGMDENGKKIFYELVLEIKKRYHLGILLVSHDLHFVSQNADKVVLLNSAVRCSGLAQDIFESEANLRNELMV